MPGKAAQRPAIVHLSADEARTLVLRAQGFDTSGSTIAAILSRVKAVQLDTIAVLARSHELVAYARLGAIGRATIEKAYWGSARAFEYYAHANCILPVEAWPFFAFRRRAFRRRVSRLVPTRAVNEVRARLRDGPVTTSDIGGTRSGVGWWGWSDGKRALEMLYLHGEAVCTTRRGWKRVYDIPERVLPSHALSREPSDAECFAYLVAQAGRALGVSTRRDLADYFRLTRTWAGSPPDAIGLLDEAIAASDLVEAEVDGWDDRAFVDPRLLRKSTAAVHRPTLLSPFDSLIWERPRTERLFGFAFSLEAYKPKAQRLHGYFTMPLLAGGRIVGRVDPAREGRTLVARRVTLDDASATADLAAALRDAAAWVGCDDVRVDEVRPRAAKVALRRALA